MEMVNIKVNGVGYEVPANSTILEAARTAGIGHPHPLLFEGHQPDRRLPYVHGRGEGRPVPGGRLCVPRQRGHGGCSPTPPRSRSPER